MKRVFLFLIKLGLGIFLLISIGIFGVVLKYRLEMPNIQELVEDYTPAAPTTIYDKNDKVVDILYTEAREIASINEIPDNIKNAFISIEDKKFYSHSGLHFKGIFRAIVINFLKGKAVQGGSSITQQLAKNAFLTSERKLSRKIKEAILTYEIERRYTKDEILEKYLNEIYFGSGSYGVKTAAEQFFKKDIKDINLAEAALLAGIPNRPSKYDPIRNLENALSRQKIILKVMLNDKKISEEEYKKAVEHKFVVEDKSQNQISKDTTIIYRKRNKNFYKNPEFTTLVEDFLQKIYSEDKIYTGGLKVYTTIDLDYQNVAREVFDNYEFFKNANIDGAMVTVDSFTGGIISIIGGKDFKAKNFDRALMAKRQYGSAFKPFLYLSSLKNGFTNYSVVVDNFISFGSWEPKNYSGKHFGNSTLVNSLNHSINIPAIKLLENIGVKKFEEETKNLRYSGKIQDLTAALGSIDGTPINLAIDFSIFVNGGYVVEPYIIKEIRDNQDNLIYLTEVTKEKLYDSIDTSLMTAMLKSVVSNGTAGRAKVLDKDGNPIEQAGKTGTTNENRTIWYAGFTPDYVTVAYIGRDDNKPMIGKITGGGNVAPLWARYYQKLIKEDLYVPSSKFSFLENHIEAGDLLKQNIDIYTGLLDGEDSKEVITRKGRIQVERAEKYRNGMATLFNLDEYVVGKTIQDEIPSYYSPITDIQKGDDDLFNRILGD